MEYLTEFGYIGLFLSSFLAATLLPLSSEVVLSFLLLNNFNPIIVVSVATFGNVLGSFVNYAAGYWGSLFLLKTVLKITEDDFFKAEKRFKKYGVFSLFFAWAPIIGDPLTIIAGVLKVDVILFLAIVTSGKLARYIIVSYLVLS